MKSPIHNEYILFVTYEDYMQNLGGVNKVILSQSDVAKQNNISSVVICPLRIVKGFIGKDLWLVRVDHEIACIGSCRDVVGYLGTLEKENYLLKHIIIHHLKNIDVHSLDYITSSIHGKIIFYIHDYYTMCPNRFGNLLDENNILCQKVKDENVNCRNCNKYNRVVEEYFWFFKRIKDRVVFIAPSDACKQLWTSVYREYSSQTRVIYHQTFSLIASDTSGIKVKNRPIKVAYVGKQIVEKGWDDFKLLVSELGETTDYELYACGDDQERLPGVENIKVSFHEGLNSMIEALKSKEIDIVLLLSICPETYSYTYYESYCANTYILAYPCAGNIARQITKNRNGKLINSSLDLVNYFKNVDLVRHEIENYKFSSHTIPDRLVESVEFLDLVRNEKATIVKQSYRVNSLRSLFYKTCYTAEKIVKKFLRKRNSKI